MMSRICIFTFLCLLLFSCSVNDVQESDYQFVDILMDQCTKQDSALFKKFKEEELIKVRVHIMPSDSMEKYLKSNKYNVDVDLLIVSDFENMLTIKKSNLLHPYDSPGIDERIDAGYRSFSKKWVALSKSPYVLVYNTSVLKRDTIKNYYELLAPVWDNKIQLSNANNSTMKNYSRIIQLLMKEKADSFLLHLQQQSVLPLKDNDFDCMKAVENKNAQLALVRMSEWAKYKKKTRKSNLNVIFPNQRKRGCYLTVTSAGMYRYAKNPMQAKKLMEFLTSKRAQFLFASGRQEFPVLRGTGVSFELRNYRKFRARFYRKRKL